MKLNVAEVSKVTGWWTVIISAIFACVVFVKATFVTVEVFYEFKRDQALKRIDTYEKIRHHYADKKETHGELDGPDKRRLRLSLTVLEREYAELESTEDIIKRLQGF